jgi:hypothetical protein
MGNKDGAKEKDGLCEGNRERVGHRERGNFMPGSGDFIEDGRPKSRVGSHWAPRGPNKERRGVSGHA